MFAFAASSPILWHSSRASISAPRISRLQVRAAQSPPPRPPGNGRGSEFEGANANDDNTDWDKSWKDFKTTSTQKGGTFGIKESTTTMPPPPPSALSESKRNKYKAETRLADAWTSDRAFLLAAALLGIVAIFYASVLLTSA